MDLPPERTAPKERSAVELRVVETFLKVAETGSLSRAADRLGYSQSAVTMQIKQLEAELGCALFDRIPRGVVLTDAGRTFAFHAHTLIEAADTARSCLSSADGEGALSGPLRIGSVESPAAALLPPVLAAFARRNPAVETVVQTSEFDKLIERCRRGELDLVLTFEQPLVLPGFTREVLCEDETVLVAAPELVPPAEGPLTPEELVRLPFVLTERGESYRQDFDRALAEHNLGVTPVIETGSTEMLLRLALGGAGVALVPRFSASRDIARGALVTLSTTLALPAMAVQMLYREQKWVTPAMNAFMRDLRLAMQAVP